MRVEGVKCQSFGGACVFIWGRKTTNRFVNDGRLQLMIGAHHLGNTELNNESQSPYFFLL